MKRALRVAMIALAFLIIGAAVTVGVAWGAIAAADWSSSRMESDIRLKWPRPVPERWPQPIQATRADHRGWHRDRLVGWDSSRPGGPHTCMIEVFHAGWPLPALRWEVWWEQQGVRPVTVDHPTSVWHLGLTYPRKESALEAVRRLASGTGRSGKRLPLRPALFGFTFNTLLYAALAAGAWYGPGVLRRRVRSRRGLCPRCGYPRAGLAEGTACPECGGVPR